MIEFISQPWAWYVSGICIAVVMLLLLLEGKSFGMSSNLRTMCSIAGGGKLADFFKFDWRAERWNLVVVLGAIIGGFIASNFLTDDPTIDLNPQTIEALTNLGIENAGQQYVPESIYGTEAVSSLKGLLILIAGGLLVGFGTRYAEGCTSGHAISGLSNLQLPSLIAVLGFFIGGLIMTHLLFPLIFS